MKNIKNNLLILLVLSGCIYRNDPYDDVDWDDVFSDEDLYYCDWRFEPDCEDYEDYYYY